MRRPAKKAAPAPAPRPVAHYHQAQGAFVDGTAYVELDRDGKAYAARADGSCVPVPLLTQAICDALVAAGVWRKEVLP